MAYEPQNWKNDQSGGTPINAKRLNHMESGINDIDTLAQNAMDEAEKKQQKGDPGDDGSAATIEIGKVKTVASDQPAKVTNSGTKNAAVLDFEIPKGESGGSK